LTKDEIQEKASAGPVCHPYAVKAWGGRKVMLKELDGLQVLELDMANLDRHKNPGANTTSGTGAEHLVRLCLVDPTTKEPMYDSSMQSITTIRNFGGALQEMYSKCLVINGMLSREIEELEKK
jgi:hypothetical protein